jgi:hypothetical protein
MKEATTIACRSVSVVGGGFWASRTVAGWVAARGGQLVLGRETVTVERQDRPPLSLPRAEIRAGFRIPGTTRAILLLHDDTRVHIDSDADVLGMLGLDLDGPPLDVKMQRIGDAVTIGVLLWIYGVTPAVGMSAAMGQPLPFLLWTAFAVCVAAVMALRRIVIGADGVLVRNGLLERFIPFQDVAEIIDLTLVTTRGKRVKVTVTGKPADRAAAAHRLREAFQRFKERELAGDLRLAQGERPFDTWIDALKRQAHDPGAFRRAGTSPETLARIVENPAAATEQRVGAAVALSSLGEDAKRRVRIAAQASVNEELRVALEAAADEELDDERYRAALKQEERR